MMKGGKHSRDLSSPYYYHHQSTRKKRSHSNHQKRISFAETATIIFILNLDEFSEVEKTKTWYKPTDVESFKLQIKSAIREIDTSNASGTGGDGGCSDVCKLGLEGFTAKGSRKRISSITKAINAVLEEQALQHLDGKDNDELLAYIYRSKTKKNMLAAQKRAMEIRPAEGIDADQ